MAFLGKFVFVYIYYLTLYIAPTQSQCLVEIDRDGGLSTLYRSCGFDCQQTVLKRFLAWNTSALKMRQSDYGISQEIGIYIIKRFIMLKLNVG